MDSKQQPVPDVYPPWQVTNEEIDSINSDLHIDAANRQLDAHDQFGDGILNN